MRVATNQRQPECEMGLVVGFDLDMTLVDSRPGIAVTLDALSAETGHAIDALDVFVITDSSMFSFCREAGWHRVVMTGTSA